MKIWLDPQSPSYSDSRKGAKTVTDYSRKYFVRSDNAAQLESTIRAYLATQGIYLGAPLAEDTRAYCHRCGPVRVVKIGPRPIWECPVEWTTDEEKSNRSPIYPYTLAKISGTWDAQEFPIDRDRDDEPIANTAGDPYVPSLVERKGIPTLTLKVNLSEFDFSEEWLDRFFNAVNNSGYRGRAAGTILVTETAFEMASWTNDDGDDEIYFPVTIRLAYNRDTWAQRPLSRGFRRKTASGKLAHIVDALGRDVSTEVPLDADGQPLFGDAVTAENIVIQEFWTKREVDFSDLAFQVGP